jgi:hypothetical protein
VIGIGGPIEKVHAGGGPDPSGNGVDDLGPAACAEVGDAFDEAGHRGQV